MADSAEKSLRDILSEVSRLSSLPAVAGGAPESAEFTLELIREIIANWTPNGIGTPGPKGDKGDQGDQGDPGEGVPTGGTTGQVLAKASNADFDDEWVNAGAGSLPAGGITGQVLTKASNADQDADWEDSQGGSSGPRIIPGSGAPTSEDGDDGDGWLDSDPESPTFGTLWIPKADGEWPTLGVAWGGVIEKLGPFSIDFSDFQGGDYLTPKELYTPRVGDTVIGLWLDPDTVVDFDADSSTMGIGQNLDFDASPNGWLQDGSGFDSTNVRASFPNSAAYVSFKQAIGSESWRQQAVLIKSTDPVVAGFDPAGPPVTPPTQGHIDLYILNVKGSGATIASGGAGGDLSGSYPDPVVEKIQGVPVIVNTEAPGALLINLEGDTQPPAAAADEVGTNVTIKAGDAGPKDVADPAANGGVASLIGGAASDGGGSGLPGTGGTALVQGGLGGNSGGNGNDAGPGGTVHIIGGPGGETPTDFGAKGGTGGDVLIEGGPAGAGFDEAGVRGGNVTIKSGASTTPLGDADGGPSGKITIIAADAIPPTGAGTAPKNAGDIEILGGLGSEGAGANDGGSGTDITIQTGAGGQAVDGSAGRAGTLQLLGADGGFASGMGTAGEGGSIYIRPGDRGGLGAEQGKLGFWMDNGGMMADDRPAISITDCDGNAAALAMRTMLIAVGLITDGGA